MNQWNFNIEKQEKKKKDMSNDTENKKKSKRNKNNNKTQSLNNYFCQECQKNYLSYPAFYTHSKRKHKEMKHLNRKRGRPKKELDIKVKENKNYNPSNLTYFEESERKGRTNKEDIGKCIIQAFKLLYNDECLGIEKHPFLGKYLLNEHKVENNLKDENENCDNIFMEYLNNMALHTNPSYFIKLIQFITLFRAYVNTKENTSKENAENLPYYSNNFIKKFIVKYDYRFSKQESIELIQNFCSWLNESNYSGLKIIKISK